MQTAIMTPERRVVFPLRADARPAPGHLYVMPETEDDCTLTLTGWEVETLAEERRRGDFLAFLRNLDRKRWALSYAYEYDGMRPAYPDLLVFRGDRNDPIVDILEPHLDAGDSVAKAKGLARFAKQNRRHFGRVEMLRKFSSAPGMYRLPLHDEHVATMVLGEVETADHLNAAFRTLGYLADW